MIADAIVIGAGAAGLAAARALARRSLRVVVLEARDRTGGRVYWSAMPGTSMPAELGAEFVHGPAHETKALLSEANLSLVGLGEEGWRFDAAAGLVPDPREFSAAASLFDGVRALPQDESVETFLRRFDADPSMREAVGAARAFVEGFDAADPRIASARGIADEWDSGNDSTSARPRSGYGPMFDFLHTACVREGVRIDFSTVVRGIAWKRGDVTVRAVDAAGTVRDHRARTAIVTVPVSILRQAFAFEPELPPEKREALRGIETGSVVKVVLNYRTPFWERVAGGRYRDAAFFRVEGRAFGAYWTQTPVRTPLVCAWVGGPRAAAMNGMTPGDLTAHASRDFVGLFGNDIRETELANAVVHDWDADPFARGAYSYLAVGAGDARAALAQPVQSTLFFAGEATAANGQGGTVNGALASGERAAAEAVRALG